jgi:hypothetical protein
LKRSEAVCGRFLEQYPYAVKTEEIMDRDEDCSNEQNIANIVRHENEQAAKGAKTIPKPRSGGNFPG